MKTTILVLFLILLSVISGCLMSKPSMVGRIGIDLFYKQYRFLKIWWQGALAVLVVWLLLLFLQGIIQKKLQKQRSVLIQSLMIVMAISGLYFTYYDFHHTLTHRWLKEGFHIGAYLFWIGWIFISLFYIVQKKNNLIQE